MTDQIYAHVKALRAAGCAVCVITPDDIVSLTTDDETDEPTVTEEQAKTWLLFNRNDVEEAIMGDYWSESVRAVLDFHPIGSTCPNDNQGQHTPDEHNQCDDCRELLPTVKLNFNAQAWVNDYAISVDAGGDTVWTVDRAEFLKQFPTEQDFHDQDYCRDHLRFEGNAPEWVRDWSGPFEVELLTFDVWETADAPV